MKRLRSETPPVCVKHNLMGDSGPSRWCYAQLAPCCLFFTILHALHVVNGVILEPVVSMKNYTQLLCPGSVHFASSIPHAALQGSHSCPQWALQLISAEQRCSLEYPGKVMLKRGGTLHGEVENVEHP